MQLTCILHQTHTDDNEILTLAICRMSVWCVFALLHGVEFCDWGRSLLDLPRGGAGT